jgi:hypothetical protein
MGSDSARNLIIGFLLFGLFSMLIVTAIYNLGTNYGVSNQKMQEATAGALSVDETTTQLEDSGMTTEQFRERFTLGDVNDIDDATGIFSIIGDIVSIIITPFNLLLSVGQNILGIPKIVGSVILAIINLVLIFGFWRVLRSGD